MAANEPSKVGKWEDPFVIENVACHATLLPNGEILCWGRRANPMSTIEDTMKEKRTVPFLLDLEKQRVYERCKFTKDQPKTQIAGQNEGVNLFCSGHCLLADGNVFTVGGHISDGDGAQQASIYNWKGGTWTALPLPNAKRWYPTALTLPDNRVFTISGSSVGQNGSWVISNTPQIWRSDLDPKKAGWDTVANPSDPSVLYPRLYLTPKGRIFVAGPQAESQFVDVDLSSAHPLSEKDPTKVLGIWNPDQLAKLPSRNGGAREAGSSVLYDVGQVLWTGGGNEPLWDKDGNVTHPSQNEKDTNMGPPTNQTEKIDLNADTPVWKHSLNMNFPRRQHNATLLPDGTVLVTGGTQGPGFNDLTPGSPVHTAELWNPLDGQWTKMADETFDRCYHGVALLLPNGKVLSAGSGEGGLDNQLWNPPKHNMTNAQLFSPPYLFNGKQPVITGVPKELAVKYGDSFPVDSRDSIKQVSWIRLGSVTHAMNMNQAVWFQKFSATQGKPFTAKVPDNRNVAPPGHYMVFFLNDQGVPSVAPIVQILPDKSSKEATPAPPKSIPNVKTSRVAMPLPKLDEQIIAEQDRPHVSVGLTPVCPYGLGPCWGGACEGLNAINDIHTVRPVADQTNSLAFVYLKNDGVLPDINTWRNEFAKTANGSYSMRGIELTLFGQVTKSDSALILAATSSRPQVVLAPFQESSNIEWDLQAQAPRPASEKDLGAYASLSSAIASNASTNVQVTGTIHKDDAGNYSLDVRSFQVNGNASSI